VTTAQKGRRAMRENNTIHGSGVGAIVSMKTHTSMNGV